MELYNVPYRVSYRNIKYPRLEFKTGKLLFVLPFGMEPDALLYKHRNWILKKTEFIRECLSNTSDKRLTDRKEEEFNALIHSLIKRTSVESSVKLNKIYFRKMKTKWASLSPKKSLTINKLMKYLPEYLVEYVVFHEITHLNEKRHNDKFWKEVARKFNNYEELEKDLFTYWFLINNTVSLNPY